MAAGAPSVDLLDDDSARIVRIGAFRDLLILATPFIFSSSVASVKLFADRMMLAWHSDISMTAAISAGMLAYFVASPFMGMVGYASAFVSQYEGASRRNEIGSCVWHAFCLGLAAGLLIALMGAAGADVFNWTGHEQRLAGEEAEYFRILTGGSVFALTAMALSCFWIGRGKIWTVLAVNLAGLCIAVALNRALIPEMGVAGAGLATVVSDALRTGILLCLILCKGNRRVYNTLPRTRFSRDMAGRLLRFGLGNGVHLMFSIGAMSLFHIFIGRYAGGSGDAGMVSASGIAFSMNSLAFIPVLGMGTAVSILVARGIGVGNSLYVRRIVRSGRILTAFYAAVVCGVFVFCPSTIVGLFAHSGGRASLDATAAFLFLAAFYFVADAMGIVYGSALRGIGDTGFSAKAKIVIGGLAFVVPCLVAIHMGAGLATLWHCVIVYAGLTAAAYGVRFRKGAWEGVRLIGPEEREVS